MAKIRKGWSKLPGTAERYLTPEGEEVSRRQYDNRRAEDLGWGTRSHYERRFDDPTYLWAYKQYRQNQKLQVGQMRKLDRMGGPVDKKLLAAAKTGWGKTPEGRDPRGPMAKLLVEMGLRDFSATYAVGETDTMRRK